MISSTKKRLKNEAKNNDLINPWKETFFQLISIATQHVASCSFLLENTGLYSNPFIPKGYCLNAEIKA